ncbi:hypothetical protein EBU95_19135, partial [bacterium]|nr:hypothetical protein [bacterium]
MSSYTPPTYINPIFNPTNWNVDSATLSLSTADARYLKISGGIETGLVTFNSGLTSSTINLGTAGNITTTDNDVNINAIDDLYIDGNVLVVDNTNDRVGILTTTPSYTLDVNGDINTSGNILIGGVNILNSTSGNVTSLEACVSILSSCVSAVTTSDALKLPLSGGTLTGNLIVGSSSNVIVSDGYIIIQDSSQKLTITPYTISATNPNSNTSISFTNDDDLLNKRIIFYDYNSGGGVSANTNASLTFDKSTSTLTVSYLNTQKITTPTDLFQVFYGTTSLLYLTSSLCYIPNRVVVDGSLLSSSLYIDSGEPDYSSYIYPKKENTTTASLSFDVCNPVSELYNTVLRLKNSNGTLRAGINKNPDYTLDVGGDINFSGTLYKNGTAYNSVSVSGSDKQIQFNDGGSSLGASSSLTYDKTTGSLNTNNIYATFLSLSDGLIASTNGSFGGYVSAGTSIYVSDFLVLTKTTLGSSVTNSSLTSLGTLNSLNVSGSTTLSSDTSLTGALTLVVSGYSGFSSKLYSNRDSSTQTTCNFDIQNPANSTYSTVAKFINSSGTRYFQLPMLNGSGNQSCFLDSNGTLYRNSAITQSGSNVGIQKTSPSYTLDVSGDINLTGNLRVNGVAQSFGSSSSSSFNAKYYLITTSGYLVTLPYSTYKYIELENTTYFGSVTTYGTMTGLYSYSNGLFTNTTSKTQLYRITYGLYLTSLSRTYQGTTTNFSMSSNDTFQLTITSNGSSAYGNHNFSGYSAFGSYYTAPNGTLFVSVSAGGSFALGIRYHDARTDSLGYVYKCQVYGNVLLEY